MIDPANSELTAVRDVLEALPTIPLEEFGVDFEGPSAQEQTSTIEVPETVSPLLMQDLDDFTASIQPTVNVQEAVSSYIEACSLLSSLLASND